MSSVDVIATIEASVDDGGWRASGQVFNDNDRLEWYQEIESWFDLYAGGWYGLPRPAFIGHLLPEPWSKTFQTSTTPFNAFTAQEFMKRGELQGIFFKDDATPTNEHQITDMTLADIVSHIVGQSGEYGHCNLVKDVWPEGIITTSIDTTNSTEIDSYEVKQGNFWQRLQEIAEIDFYYLWVDKANVLHFEPHPMFGASLPTAVFDLDSALLSDPLEIENRNTEKIGQVRLNGTTPAGAQISGRYPTEPTAGPIISKSNYIGTADTLMADVAERMYKFENRSHTVNAQVGNGTGLLVDLMDRVTITYTSAVDGVAWSAKEFWIHKIKVDILANFTARTIFTLEAEGDV